MRWFTGFALAVAIAIGTAVSPFASSSPDGLEKVAEEQGFLDRGRTAPVQERAPAAGYAFPGVGNARLATALAGFAGTLAVFLLSAGVVAVVRRSGTA
jgi:PDGLE domain